MLPLIMFVAFGSAAAPPLEAAAIDRLARTALRDWRVPGFALAIVRDDEVIYLKGHGVRAIDGDEPVTADTLFPIASCTKAFTAAALAALVDDGKLGWDDPVRKHLPYFRLSDPEADSKVTLRDLLLHRTGLRSHDFLWYHAPWPLDEQIRRAGRLSLDQPFRDAFQYQSTMVAAAGQAGAAAADVSWEELVRRRLVEPLGMEAAFTTLAAEKLANRARPHRLNRVGQPAASEDYRMESPDPAGSMHASARGLTQWLRLHLNDGKLGARRIVSAATIAEMHRRQMPIRLEGIERELHSETKQMHYGLGWVVYDYRGQTVVSHAGAIDGFRAHLTLLPERKIGIAILANLHHTRMNLALSNSLIDRLAGLPAKDWNGMLQGVIDRHDRAEHARSEQAKRARRGNIPPEAPLAAYAGFYAHPAYGDVHIRVTREGMTWTWNRFAARLHHHQGEEFTLPIAVMSEPIVTFRLDERRRPIALAVARPLGVEFRKRDR